jgi:hypothetical protein
VRHSLSTTVNAVTAIASSSNMSGSRQLLCRHVATGNHADGIFLQCVDCTGQKQTLSSALCTCVCCPAAGFGVTPANPTTCTMCDRNFFSEGALGPSQLVSATASIARMPAPTSRPLPLTGPKSSSAAQQPANLTVGASAPAPTAPPKSSSQVQQPPAPTGAPPSAPAPVVPVMSAAPSLLPPSLAKAQQTRQQDDAVATAPQLLESAAAATAAAGVRSRQQGAQAVSTASVVRPQQVNPVFSTPTYYPCTFCGPGCTTDGPGATSPQQCSK